MANYIYSPYMKKGQKPKTLWDIVADYNPGVNIDEKTKELIRVYKANVKNVDNEKKEVKYI